MQSREITFFKGSTFCPENELLHCKTQNGQQMVLPMSVRNMVLKIGHSISWDSHLGSRKMYHQISKHFFLPGMTQDIAEFCKTCPEHQYSAPHCPPKASLMALPVIEVPFQ